MAEKPARRPLFVLVFLLLPVAALAAAVASGQSPAPPAADAPSLTPGDSWTIRYSDGSRGKRTFLKEESGILVFEISQAWADGSTSQGLLHLTRDLATVRMLDASGREVRRFDPHSLGLRFPLSVGKQWQERCERFDEGKPAGTFVGAFRVVGIEDVTGPSGTHRTYRVDGQTSEARDPSRVWRFSHWYAPEARMEVRLRALEPDGSFTEFELSEFRPAGFTPPRTLLAPRAPGQGPEAFLGVWDGHWKEMILATKLAVERIEGDAAFVTYWRGAYIFPGLQRPRQQRAEGRLLDEKTLRVEIWDDTGQRWAEAIYSLQSDGTLAAQWRSGDIKASATLRKEP